MSNHFVAINRGKDGLAPSDFTFGTSTSAAADIELRIADVDANGNPLSRRDVILALEAFERVYSGQGDLSTFPPL